MVVKVRLIFNKPMSRICVAVAFLCLVATSKSVAVANKHVLFWQGTFQSASEMAITLHKPMMLSFDMPNDFENQLDTITYRDPRVAYFVGATCLPFRIEGYSPDSVGKALIALYKVKYFPTVIVTESNGKEIDRMVGYYPPRQFIFFLENFINDKNTAGDLERRLFADTNNLSLAFQLASRFEMRVELDTAMHYFEHVIFHGSDTSLLVQRAKFHLGDFHLKVFGNPNFLNEVIERTWVDSLRYASYNELIAYYQKVKLRDSLLAISSRAVAAYPHDADFLNNDAWNLAVMGGNLDTAHTLAKRAIAVNAGIADYYDTMAEIYMRQNDYSDALTQIQKALRLKNNDPYFKHREKECRAALAKTKTKNAQ